MYPTLKSIKKYMYPLLDNQNEVCLYYYDVDDSWHNGTYASNPTTCNHSQGYIKIMGHTHPRRMSTHAEEVNYYPSYQDITYPIYNSINQKNYILTPIGLFIATYELTGYNFTVSPDQEKLYNEYINELFYPIHTMLSKMGKDLTLSAISKELTPNIIVHINHICKIITDYINSNILTHFPKKDYNLTYIDISQINKLSGGIYKKKTHKKHIKKTHKKHIKKTHKKHIKKTHKKHITHLHN
jgi:hypothetical protein